jgi:hypothetical protein
MTALSQANLAQAAGTVAQGDKLTGAKNRGGVVSSGSKKYQEIVKTEL